MLTYAQNFEDVMLARLFDQQATGFYVDVGAHHPTELSVTKHFYDLGWRGINVEPVLSKWTLFEDLRPRDININAVVSSQSGDLTVYYVHGNDALTTASAEQARSLSRQGFVVSEFKCPSLTLDAILAKHAPESIDFIKVDTEGFEADVLQTIDLEKWRPVAFVIESVSDQDAFTTWSAFDVQSASMTPPWEAHLLERGYVFAHFDGLNRFYIKRERADLAHRLRIPPSVFDHIMRDTLASVGSANLSDISVLEGKEAEIQRMAGSLIEKEDKIQALVMSLEEKEAEIQKLSKSLVDRQAIIERLDAAVALSHREG